MKSGVIALALAGLASCATHPPIRRLEPSPPAGSESIRLVHANAHDVARTLNDLDAASFWKAMSRGCVLYKADGVKLMRVPMTAQLEEGDHARIAAMKRWSPVERPAPSAESSAAKLREHLARPSTKLPGPDMAPPPPTFWVSGPRTLVVLEAHRDEEYFDRVRDLVDRLDSPSAD